MVVRLCLLRAVVAALAIRVLDSLRATGPPFPPPEQALLSFRPLSLIAELCAARAVGILSVITLGDHVQARRPTWARRLLPIAVTLFFVTVTTVALVIQAQIWRFEATQTRGGADWDWYTLRLKLSPQCPTQKPPTAMLPPAACTPPPIYVLEGRDHSDVNPQHAASWLPLKPRRIDVHTLSLALKAIPGCHPFTWENRLFTIYRHVFAQALQEFPNEAAFVFVEDDVRLTDPDKLRRELCWQVEQEVAHHRSHYFFSFFRDRAGPEHGCIYYYGTQAFLANRAMLEHLISLPPKTLCRMPIDLYIKKLGPWYVPDEQYVLHEGTRTRLTEPPPAVVVG